MSSQSVSIGEGRGVDYLRVDWITCTTVARSSSRVLLSIHNYVGMGHLVTYINVLFYSCTYVRFLHVDLEIWRKSYISDPMAKSYM